MQSLPSKVVPAVPVPATRVREAVGAFLGGRRSPQTRDAYRRDCDALVGHLGGNGPEALIQATVGDLVGWRDRMQADGLAPATVARRLAGVRTVLKFLQSEGLVATNPAQHVEAPRVEARAKAPWLEVADARALLEAPDPATERGLRDRAILRLLLCMGLRRAEVCGLRLGSMERDGAGWQLKVEGKGQKVRRLHMNGTAAAVLAYLAATGREPVEGDASWMFPSPRDPSRPLSGNMIYRLTRSYAAKARCAVRDGETFAPHGARRTFATVALDRGATLEGLRRALGHSSPATTAAYDRRPDASLVIEY